MEIDALARAVLDGYASGDFSAPPFPPHAAPWAERQRRDAEAESAKLPPEQRAAAEAGAALPAFESVTAVDIGKLDDLEIHLYRAEPGAVALLLVVRDGALAYTSLAGNWFAMPEELRSADFPPHALASMATGARALGELDVQFTSMSSAGNEPISVEYEIERARYDALDAVAREDLHRALTPIARDTALLFLHRNGPLRVGFVEPHAYEPDEPRGRRPTFAEFDAV
jgi:hypothetical protein